MDAHVKRRAQRPRGRPPAGAREALVEAARGLFAERGYDSTSTEEILERSGVSRGAMYHHFRGKLELFEALYGEIEDALMVRLAAAVADGGALDQLRAGSRAYLRESGEGGDFALINLRQARQVLGHDRWRELAAERGLAAIRGLISAAVDAGELEPLDAGDAAAIYMAALIEAGLLVADSDDPDEARRSVAPILDRLLAGLAQG